jgi:hypothetical protein
MIRTTSRRFPEKCRAMAGLLGVMLLTWGGCAGDPPKSSPTVMPEQVRGHADKAFEKLKQEEQQREADPAVGR